ncbi:phosphoglycolate phosphatase 1B, chloroplastic-like [Phalaenopsis equestris]|uniref:phosphoglycolate phosphatase 1B, chloroplastic-like n=1 Tax=Phalaenopsis equestris TaxID=78828 RepID=UPI0009E1985B|nr:phosphoglycolate phosphatase 1B, chloroplastic-like [Phalaenopsis equestris]
MLITTTASIYRSCLSFFCSPSSPSSKTLISSLLPSNISFRSGLLGSSSLVRRRRGHHSWRAASASKEVMQVAAKRLENPDELIDSVETFIFDCDGVVWKGDKLIDGVPETLDMLRSKGTRQVFVTNNSTKSRKQYGKKFETLGLNVSEEEIFASSFAAAAYLESIDFPKDKKVYVIGEDGILKELELAGFQYLGGPADGEKKIELKPGFLMEHDKNVGAVVVGFDRYVNYYKIQYGTLCIRENPGCLFIATNRDAVTHLTDAQEWAGGGSMVGAIYGSTRQEPTVVGKPSTFMMDYLSQKFGILKSQICMVGDRLDTDVLFGQNGGCRTLLVLSGVTTLQMLQNPSNPIQPDFYAGKVSDFLGLKAAAV